MRAGSSAARGLGSGLLEGGKLTEASPLVAAPGGDDEAGTLRVWSTLGGSTRLVLVTLISTSLCLNIVALLPFVVEFELIAGPEMVARYIDIGNYNFSAILSLLRRNGMVVLMAIIIIWTCVFPPFKLCLMVYTLAVRTSERCRSITYGWLGHNARLSLMEIYLAQLLIMITTNQDHRILVIDLVLHVEIRIGIVLFHAAILLSMVAGEILEQIDYARHQRAPPHASIAGHTKAPVSECWPVLRGSPGWAMLALVFSSARLALAACAFFLPMLTVGTLAQVPPTLQDLVASHNATVLLPNTWSLEQGIRSMASSSNGFQNFFSIDMGIFLLVIPIASALLSMWCVLKPIGGVPTGALRLMHVLARFSNLEVFLLAFLIYLSEQEHMVLVQVRSAFYCLLAYVPALVGSLVCTTKAVRSAEEAGAVMGVL